jgi:hypothetical protein
MVTKTVGRSQLGMKGTSDFLVIPSERSEPRNLTVAACRSKEVGAGTRFTHSLFGVENMANTF